MKSKLGSQSLAATVDEIQIYDNDDKATKCSLLFKYFTALSLLSKISSAAVGFGHLILLHIFFNLAFLLILGWYFLYPGCYG